MIHGLSGVRGKIQPPVTLKDNQVYLMDVTGYYANIFCYSSLFEAHYSQMIIVYVYFMIRKRYICTMQGFVFTVCVCVCLCVCFCVGGLVERGPSDILSQRF